MENKKAYVTVLSTDKYLIGVLALNEALKNVKSKYDLAVLINNNISEKSKKILKDSNIKTIQTNSLDLPEWIREKNKKHTNWNYTFDKLNIFELTEYEKIVFLDSDMYIRKNIDELFEKKHLSATVDRNDTVLVSEDYQKLTSGMMVIEPKKGSILEFLKIMENEEIKDKYNELGDQDIIQLYDTEWPNKKELHLPVKYNMFFLDIEYYINRKIYKLEDISIIHFITAHKPWDYELDKLETSYLDWLEQVSCNDYEKNKLDDIKENIEFGRENKKIIIREYGKILEKCKNEIEKFK